ncbi:hypothetical protein MMC17_001605 [Xylographa soralifera]|nr:hypothetical protein [Xylographa soralifera]
MSFRKRNVGISGPLGRVPVSVSGSPLNDTENVQRLNRSENEAGSVTIPGVRPSPLDGRLTTSTGTQSLDNLLAGHAGLALGCSILLEESGTTDYAGTLLRYYAAEGVAQQHHVHVVGVGEQWGRELPGLINSSNTEQREEPQKTEEKEKMKIAWRYEKLGEFDGGSSSSRGGIASFANPVHKLKQCHLCKTTTVLQRLMDTAPPSVDRSPSSLSAGTRQLGEPAVFCHSFDLTKRLTLPSPTAIDFIPLRPVQGSTSPFPPIFQAISQRLSSSNPDSIHRLVIPILLSPALYPPSASNPENILQFLHSLRALLRQYPTRLTAIISLPLTLYPRITGLICWMELLSDGVIELAPFPHTIDTGPSLTTSGAATAEEEKPQGMIKVHRLPIFHERGGGGPGGAGVGDDLAFTVSRRRFVIKPFSLPPVEGDTEAQKGDVGTGKATKVDIDF